MRAKRSSRLHPAHVSSIFRMRQNQIVILLHGFLCQLNKATVNDWIVECVEKERWDRDFVKERKA
jgi:hypothetical protein